MASFISFTIALSRDPNYKEEEYMKKAKNVFYDNMLYLKTSKCSQCNKIKPCRSSHCDNCHHCV